MSPLVLVTASTAEPISLTETKLWLRLDEHDVAEDPLVTSLIVKARQTWEARTQRAALVQTFDTYLDQPLEDDVPVALPKAPLVSVTSIRGFATTDATDSGGTAMSTSGYYVDTAQEFGRVALQNGFTWPTATRPINPVIIRFTAGYSSGSSGVPETVKTEIKQLVARLYEHRGDEQEQMQALAEYGTVPTDLDLPTWG
jgi:uncharacterized phiE125 gp8 family phage protein